MTFEVVTRWGDDLLDVQYVDEHCLIAGVELALVDGATGMIGQVEYAITKATLPARSLPYTRGDDRKRHRR